MKKYHIYKGKLYRIVLEAKMKHPEKTEWVDAVCYTNYVNVLKPGAYYVRMKSEFLQKFREATTDEIKADI